MLFNSFAFLLFFPIVCILYYAMPTLKARNLFLLAASYYFYMNWEPVYALLLLSSTLITYVAALGMTRSRAYRKGWLWGSLILNLLILFFFKYYEFAAENLAALLGGLGLSIHIPEFKVLLPVGISFYIFQALGYSIDVYRGETAAEKNFFTYALFVSFFPQLVAGPIERSTRLLGQFRQKHSFDADRAISGIGLMLWGYFMKLVMAERCAFTVNTVYDHLPFYNSTEVLLASVLFCFQLYGDFAGYSYIAIGSARIMGFDLMENFRRPYLYSTSMQEFWKRNHISLTTWFMDYVYYPLVGSSTRLVWWCVSIFLTFTLSGFWHGANWTYVVCFALFGLVLVGDLLVQKRQRKWEKRHRMKERRWYAPLRRFVTFLMVCLILVFFRAETLSDAWLVIQKLFDSGGYGGVAKDLYGPGLLVWFLPLCLKEYLEENRKPVYERSYGLAPVLLVHLALILLIVVFTPSSTEEFIYFQF